MLHKSNKTQNSKDKLAFDDSKSRFIILQGKKSLLKKIFSHLEKIFMMINLHYMQ